MENKNEAIAPLILLGIEELVKDIAIVELPTVIKYTQGRIDYWKKQGEAIHIVRIMMLEAEVKAFEFILKELNTQP